ncbi:MATE family efflux transporter, partial [Butyricicoccus sp.]|uniref:MATE family efflux transporter n=1 Tax=Butyricicoccus sp. TaxID=2049021 RepID=UPI003AAE4296
MLVVFIGLAQGIQPLFSLGRGEGNLKQEHRILQQGIGFNVFLSLLIYGVMVLFGRTIIGIFNPDAQMI